MTRWNGTPLERFTAKYVVVLSTGCWEWIAGTNGRYPVPSRCDDCCDKHELARRERNARKVAA